MTTNTCTCDRIIQGSNGATATYRILGVLCPTCEAIVQEEEMAASKKVQWTAVHGQRRLESASKSGKAVILVRETSPERFDVTALDGHELLPGTRRDLTESAARAHANTLWARY
ncbi:hypothetical protein SEA_NOSHOW_40 [Mycobacterium phage NoShow]|nr:hypothetical protein SEA_NOSHOW_40 [Mycobacterium phage NoShow]